MIDLLCMHDRPLQSRTSFLMFGAKCGEAPFDFQWNSNDDPLVVVVCKMFDFTVAVYR